MLLGCVYLKLLKGGERFKMNTASKQTRMLPSFSLKIMLSKLHDDVHNSHIVLLFTFLLFSAMYMFLSSAHSVMLLVMQRLKQKQCGHCLVNQPHIVNSPEFLNQFQL